MPLAEIERELPVMGVPGHAQQFRIAVDYGRDLLLQPCCHADMKLAPPVQPLRELFGVEGGLEIVAG